MRILKLRKYIATTLLLFVSSWSVLAGRQADNIAAIKTETGYLIVWNGPEIHFTLGLNGKDVRPMARPGAGSVAFNIDGVVFQVQTVVVSEFLKNVKKQKLSDQAILMAQRDWETRYIEQAAGTKLNVSSSPQQLDNGSQALIWKYDRPKTRGSEQIYLTMVSGGNVVILNGVVSERNAASAVQQLLLSTISTLRVSPRPIDVMKVRESIR